MDIADIRKQAEALGEQIKSHLPQAKRPTTIRLTNGMEIWIPEHLHNAIDVDAKEMELTELIEQYREYLKGEK